MPRLIARATAGASPLMIKDQIISAHDQLIDGVEGPQEERLHRRPKTTDLQEEEAAYPDITKESQSTHTLLSDEANR